METICKKCGNKFLKDGNKVKLCFGCHESSKRYSNEFRKISKQMIEINDCNICQENQKDKLVVHHKNIKKNDNSPENLVTLCRSCHSKLHSQHLFYKRNYANKSYNQLKEIILKKLSTTNLTF